MPRLYYQCWWHYRCSTSPTTQKPSNPETIRQETNKIYQRLINLFKKSKKENLSINMIAEKKLKPWSRPLKAMWANINNTAHKPSAKKPVKYRGPDQSATQAYINDERLESPGPRDSSLRGGSQVIITIGRVYLVLSLATKHDSMTYLDETHPKKRKNIWSN